MSKTPRAKLSPDPAKPLRNQRHERFVQGILQGLKNTDAYVAAGYKHRSPATAATEGYKLLRNPHISGRLAYLKSLCTDQSVLTRTWLIAETRATHLVAREEGQLAAALAALKMLGQECGVVVEKREAGKRGDLSDMSDVELDCYIAELEAADIGGSVRHLYAHSIDRFGIAFLRRVRWRRRTDLWQISTRHQR